MSYEEKKIKLLEEVDRLSQEDVVLAFSGGVDSSLLLKLFSKSTKKTGKKVYAVTVHTKIHPMKDLEISRRVADEMGVEHKIISIDELKEAGIEDNPVNRCYLCKKSILKNYRDMQKNLV